MIAALWTVTILGMLTVVAFDARAEHRARELERQEADR